VVRYRVGNHLGRTLYRDDQLIGLMDSEIDAKLITRLLNNDVIDRDSSCICESYEPCAGECCGAGQCSCSRPDGAS
jgi:hypothetical protein